MPAAQEDVNAVRAEGIEILELLAPISWDGATLRCERTELGAYDANAFTGLRSILNTARAKNVQLDRETVRNTVGIVDLTQPPRSICIATVEQAYECALHRALSRQ